MREGSGEKTFLSWIGSGGGTGRKEGRSELDKEGARPHWSLPSGLPCARWSIYLAEEPSSEAERFISAYSSMDSGKLPHLFDVELDSPQLTSSLSSSSSFLPFFPGRNS